MRSGRKLLSAASWKLFIGAFKASVIMMGNFTSLSGIIKVIDL